MEILKKIKEARKKKGLSQKGIADKLNISVSTYQKMEQGILILSLERFLKICQILQIESYNEFLPSINSSAVEKIELILNKNRYTLKKTKDNAAHCRKILEEVKNENNDENLSDKLELIDQYLFLINRESGTDKYENATAVELLRFLD